MKDLCMMCDPSLVPSSIQLKQINYQYYFILFYLLLLIVIRMAIGYLSKILMDQFF